MTTFAYIKRDKGTFHRTDISLERKLEEEFDNIVRGINQKLKQKDEETTKIVNQISHIQTKGIGAALTNIVAYNEQIFHGGENNNIIRDINVESLITNVTLTDATDLFTKIDHGLVNNDIIAVSSIVTTTGLSTTTGYYIINVSGNNFQVSLTSGGAPVVLGGGNGSCSVRKATVIVLTNVQAGDLIKLITIITKTIDNGIIELKLNDGTNDLFNKDSIDTSITSAQSPAKAMWLEYTVSANLTLTLIGATTYAGKIIIEILRKPQVSQGFSL